ncbi:MAG TPA: serine/threonine-protein kinase [Bryobacteraceae bacterium]|nr:serine/threonine-protein kinase [Bryobacteraceae bacterium]
MQLPARIGKYELLEFLGGRMAEVYRARDLHLNRPVAFKMLSSAGLSDAETKDRFLAEARLTGNLAHDNITAYYDYGEVDGRPYLVMEYVGGGSLGEAIREGRTGDLREKLRIARQIATALEYVHSKGIVHRDVKPDNVRMDASGKVKLTDFGIAKAEELSLTGAGFTVGTPYYMAPEQVRGRKPTPLVDVYGFGVLLYELVTGLRPFTGDTVDEIFDKILHRPLDLGPLAAVSAALRELIGSSTDKDPARRPQDFKAVEHRLDEILETAGHDREST